MVNVAITGATGRMGRALVSACLGNPNSNLTAAIERPDNSLIGKDIGEIVGINKININLISELESVVDHFDVLIDFTNPDSTLANLAICHRANKRIVIGTTGFNPQQRANIAKMAQDIAVVLAPNMSVGVNLVFKLLELAAKVLGDEADVEIIEAHHRHKLDAPSGTALRMGEVIAATLGRDLADCAIYGREGKMGERSRQTIGFETIRAGDIVGEHTVLFASTGERVEIAHKASDRSNFAKGALRAVHWVIQKEKGLFDMQDVLGLR